MEHRVLYLNKLLLLFWAGTMGLTFYSSSKPKTATNIWVGINSAKLVYANGLLYYQNKPYTGWLYENYDNGTPAKQIPYYEGKIEGTMRTWYENKTPEQVRTYTTGEKQGLHRGWWPNCNPKFEYQFVNDEHNGTAKEWFNNKQLYRSFNYKMGHEEGRQQLWWDDGSIRANYVVKGGRQYGLIGRKLCKNIYKK